MKYSISRILEAIKLPVTRRAKGLLEQTSPQQLRCMLDAQRNGRIAYRFWQRGGGFDRNSVEPAAIPTDIDHLHCNPVRRGLVERPEDWFWSSAAWYAGATDVPLTPDTESLPRLYPA